MADKKQTNIKEIFSETEADIIRKSKYIESQVRSNKNNFNSVSNMLSKKFKAPLQAPQINDKKKANTIQKKTSENSLIVKIKGILLSQKLWLALGLSLIHI